MKKRKIYSECVNAKIAAESKRQEVVIRKIFLSETGTKDLEITKKWKIVSDKKVGDGHVPSIPQSVTGQKISDKNPPYLSPVNFFSISSSVTVYLAEFNLE